MPSADVLSVLLWVSEVLLPMSWSFFDTGGAWYQGRIAGMLLCSTLNTFAYSTSIAPFSEVVKATFKLATTPTALGS
jgi:hypothetical protein